MSDEKPLHVRVAEALGWTWKASPSGRCRFLCPPTCDNPHDIIPSDYRDADADMIECVDSLRYVPRYDTDWSAAGPLIEKYGFTLCSPTADGDPPTMPWEASFDWRDPAHFCHTVSAEGPAPLIAVCNLLLKLHEAGKLR